MEEINQTDNIKKNGGKGKLAIFDLYGTIAQRPEDYFSIIQDVKEEIAKNIGEDPNKNIGDIYRKLKTYLKTNPANIEKPIILDDGTKITLSNDIIKRFKQNIDGVVIYDDALEAIDYLKKNGYKIAVMSNLSEAYEAPLRDPKKIPPETFDYEILSYKLGKVKPNVELFEYVKEISGIDYDDMIMIGDTLTDDIEPAGKLGIKSIYVVRSKNQESDEQKLDENGNVIEYTYNETSTGTKYAQVSSLRESILEQLNEIIS